VPIDAQVQRLPLHQYAPQTSHQRAHPPRATGPATTTALGSKLPTPGRGTAARDEYVRQASTPPTALSSALCNGQRAPPPRLRPDEARLSRADT
jgi:hypothetical protein